MPPNLSVTFCDRLLAEGGYRGYDCPVTRRAVNPDQLKMFMTPREVVQSVGVFNDMGETKPTMRSIQTHDEMSYKNAENHVTGLHDSIAREGVKKPINIVHGAIHENPDGSLDTAPTRLANGHHRIISQAQLDPDRLMPVLHHGGDYAGIDWSNHSEDPTGDKPIADMAEPAHQYVPYEP